MNEIINKYNKALVDILRTEVINNEPEKLDDFNEDIKDTIDIVIDDEEFRDELLSTWRYLKEDNFGLHGYGIHVEVAKQHPKLKEQARDIIKYEIETPDSNDWLQRGDFCAEDIFEIHNIKEEVDYIVKYYNQLQEWEKFFGIEFDLYDFSQAVACYIDEMTDLELPRDEDIIRLLPKDVFSTICDFRQY